MIRHTSEVLDPIAQQFAFPFLQVTPQVLCNLKHDFRCIVFIRNRFSLSVRRSPLDNKQSVNQLTHLFLSLLRFTTFSHSCRMVCIRCNQKQWTRQQLTDVRTSTDTQRDTVSPPASHLWQTVSRLSFLPLFK